MATQIDDDTFVEDDPGLTLDDEDDGQSDGENGDEGDAGEPDPGDDEHDEISIGGTALTGEAETEGVRNMRSHIRKLETELREAKAGKAAPELGPKPDIDDDKYLEDPRAFEPDLLAWKEREREVSQAREAAAAKERAMERDYEQAQARHERERAELRVPDFDAASDVVDSKLDPWQLKTLFHASGGRAALTYALGKDPARLEKLASITNPIVLAAEIGRIDKEITVTRQRRDAPPPEQRHRGHSGSAGGRDAKLERLEREAAKTGIRTALIDYKREKGL